MRMFKLFLSLVLLLVLSSSMAMAQCPNGKTAFVWMNGVLVGDQTVNGVTTKGNKVWNDQVQAIGTNFFAAHPTLSQNCVVFVPVYNNSQGFRDFLQSANQWLSQDVDAFLNVVGAVLGWVGVPDKFVSALKSYNTYIQLSDPDLVKLVLTVNVWSSAGYTIVLVGHSQGTFYTNRAYEVIRDKYIVVPSIMTLPDPNKLSIINIASAAGYVADGREMYTTQCGDIILQVPGSLHANVNNTTVPCAIAVPPGTALHDLDVAYLSTGLNTQKQIYAQLEDSLYKPITLSPETNTISIAQGTSGFVDLNLKSENGISGNGNVIVWCVTTCPAGFTYNWPQVVSLPGNGTVPLRITFGAKTSAVLGTNKYEFWVTINGNTAKAKIAVTVTAPPPTTGTINISMLGYTGSVSCSLNGGATFTVPTSPATILTNQIAGGKNLSCQTVSGYTMAVLPSSTQTLLVGGTIYYSLVFTPVTATPLMASCSANPTTIVAGQSTTFTGVSSGGISPRTGVWGGVVSGSNLTTTYTSTILNVPGPINVTYTVTDSAVPQHKIVANCQVTITAPVATTGTVAVTTTSSVATSCTLNGTTITAPITLTNQTVGTKSLSCTAPAGYTLTSITPSATQTLSAGGTITFTVNLTAVLPPFTAYCSFAQNPATVGQYDLLTIFQAGGVGSITYAINGLSLGTSNTFNIFLSTAGVLTDSVSATDGMGRVASNSCSTNVIAPQPFTISCSFAENPAKVYKPIVVTIAQNGGVAPINYNQNGVNLGTSNTFSYTATSAGSMTALVTATDATGKTANNTCSIPVVQILPTPNGSFSWTLSSWQSQGAQWIVQPVLTYNGVPYRLTTPLDYIAALQQLKNWGSGGSIDLFISQFQGAMIYWI